MKTLNDFIQTQIRLDVSLFSEEHDGAVVITPSGKEIGLDHENGFSFMNGDFYVSDNCVAVLIYDGEFFIEQTTSGNYFMQIENQGFTSDNLAFLENLLYEWQK